MNKKDAKGFIADFLELLTNNQLCDAFHINFYGGEPLLAWDLVKMLISTFGLYYKKKRIIWTINTNGRLLDEGMMSFLKKYKVELHISCDGRKEINDKLRRSSYNQGTFDEIQRAFDLTTEHKIYKQINAVISNINISNLRDIVDLAKENKIGFIYLDILYKPHKILEIDKLVKAYMDAVKYAEQKNVKIGSCCISLADRISRKRTLVITDKYDLLRSLSISTGGGIYPLLFKRRPVSGTSLKAYFHEKNKLWQNDFDDITAELSNECSKCFLFRYCCYAGILQYRYHTKLEIGHEDSCRFLKEYILSKVLDETR